MSAERSCEVCGSGEPEPLYHVDGFGIVKCHGCGLVFVSRPPAEEELGALYDESYYESADQPGYGSYSAAEERKRHHDRTLLDEIESLRAPGDLLEIGCAYGYFLDEARRRGWRVHGVEPSRHAARYARQQLHLDVVETPFSELRIQPDSLDAIVLWDVVEHLPNPRETIERARAWLRPGGIVALSTGDVESLAARLHGPDWSLMTPPWHQFYFSRKTIRRLLEELGFSVLKVGGDGSVAVDRASSRGRVPGPIASVLTAPPVVRVARRLGAGSILFAYARKPMT